MLAAALVRRSCASCPATPSPPGCSAPGAAAASARAVRAAAAPVHAIAASTRRRRPTHAGSVSARPLPAGAPLPAGGGLLCCWDSAPALQASCDELCPRRGLLRRVAAGDPSLSDAVSSVSASVSSESLPAAYASARDVAVLRRVPRVLLPRTLAGLDSGTSRASPPGPADASCNLVALGIGIFSIRSCARMLLMRRCGQAVRNDASSFPLRLSRARRSYCIQRPFRCGRSA